MIITFFKLSKRPPFAILDSMQESEKINAIKKWLGPGSINIFGRPFSGKDTQGRQLATLLGGNLLGGGDILRSDNIPDHIKQIMRDGKLIPSEDYVKIVLPNLSNERLAGHPIVLSSVGRWIGEESSVIEATKTAGHPLMAVINLDIDESVTKSRWQLALSLGDRGNRHDDINNTIDVRLAEYKNKTEPVLDAYKNLGLLIDVDGDQPAQKVTHAIINKLYDYLSAQ